jgi:uncharacterized membrane protein YbaN (DUF454 family)
MKIKKKFLCAAGIILTCLGAVGAVLPLLPAFPFLMGAMFCFARSSDKMNAWFLNTSLYKNHLESYVKKRAMTIKTKLTLLASLTMAMAIGFFAMSRIPVGQIILAIVWLFHILFFFFGIKTLKVEATADVPPQAG